MRKKADKRERLRAARTLLGLERTASLAEVKLAYRKKAKEHHPDLAEGNDGEAGRPEMHQLTEAYQLLSDHCANYPIPLEPEQTPLDDEEWWMDRFGNDPLWGKGKG